MSKNQEFNSIEDFLENIPENYNILEETINIETQKKFFEISSDLLKNKPKKNVNEMIAELGEAETSIETKKTTLTQLAIIESVEAYRAIESYHKNPDIELKDWSVLALQQSKMVLQSSLMDEQQVFISTGLGGKDNMLRYFMVFPFNEGATVETTQKKMLSSELQFNLTPHDGVVEEIKFTSKYATCLVLMHLKTPVPDIIRNILNECNQFGNYLSDNIVITNTKKLSENEIIEILKNNEQKD